jgi:hypothetical protein
MFNIKISTTVAASSKNRVGEREMRLNENKTEMEMKKQQN